MQEKKGDIEKMDKKRKLKNTADEFWRLCVIKKYGQYCEVCDDTGHDAHHFIPRSQSAILRHNIDNGVILCQSCHIGIHRRQDPTINNDIIEKRGKDWYKKIKEIYKNNKKQSLGIKHYEKVIEGLEEYLQKI